jgi:hypothetical protein
LPNGNLCSIFVPMTMSEIPKPNPEASSPAPARRGGSSGIRRATRREKVRREERIVGLLNRGASVPEIAASEGLTLKRMRNVVRDILSQRMPQPPAEFLALQVSRLNEALLVSFTAMHDPKRVRTSRPSIVSSRSCANSTAITDSPLSRGRARKRRRTGCRPLSSVRLRSKVQARVTR